MDREGSMDGEIGNKYRILVRKPEVKTPPRRLRRRWQYNIKINIKETGYESVDRIYLAQDRDQWLTVMNKAFRKRQGIS
jgi:hypothetical protein